MLTERGCPICSNKESKVLLDHMIEDFDDVTFNRQVLIVSCDNCGAVYNDMNINVVTLEKHYQDETLYSGETGFGIGGTTPADMNRYSYYLKFLNPVLSSKDMIIADMGCAKGGFLAFLKNNGFTKLRGIEVDPKCVEYARNNLRLNVEKGSVDCMPFDSGEINMLVYNHVLEHLYNPMTALHEAKRVLKDDGLVFIEVPDASRYSEGRVFDYFWACMREHINHFDLAHLNMLMELAGFDKVDACRSLMPNSSQYFYPSLCALYRKGNDNKIKSKANIMELCDAVLNYVNTENYILNLHRNLIAGFIEDGRPVYVWGIGLEFFSLYSLSNLRQCNISYLVDRNPVKQTKTVNGLKIISPECFQSVPPDAIVFIASVFHKNEMINYLKQIGFKGEIVSFD
jgi:SAM-dependent methyltransferase